MYANFQAKRTILTFLTQICPKMDFWWDIQKAIAGVRISILEIPCVPIFRQNGQLTFLAQICPKRKLGFEI